MSDFNSFDTFMTPPQFCNLRIFPIVLTLIGKLFFYVYLGG
jgi:hypothetical protein